VHPQHVFDEDGDELGRRAKIWATRPIWPDGSSHGRGGWIWRFLGSPVPTALRLDCLLPLMSLQHGGDWQRGGAASLVNNGGGPRIPSIAKMMICRCLSPSIRRKWRVSEGCASAPWGVLCLEFAGSGGIRSCTPMFYSDRLVIEGAFEALLAVNIMEHVLVP
jgi:hypothetical protein